LIGTSTQFKNKWLEHIDLRFPQLERIDFTQSEGKILGLKDITEDISSIDPRVLKTCGHIYNKTVLKAITQCSTCRQTFQHRDIVFFRSPISRFEKVQENGQFRWETDYA
jgi:hypothetical protein